MEVNLGFDLGGEGGVGIFEDRYSDVVAVVLAVGIDDALVVATLEKFPNIIKTSVGCV